MHKKFIKMHKITSKRAKKGNLIFVCVLEGRKKLLFLKFKKTIKYL